MNLNKVLKISIIVGITSFLIVGALYTLGGSEVFKSQDNNYTTENKTIVKEEMILFLMITLIFIFLAASGIYYFEHEAQPKLFPSVIHSVWWAIVTLTTVGYGDVYPITVGGKIFTFFMLMIGIAVITIPAGLVASAFTKAREIEKEEIEKKHQRQKLYLKD